ncbi:MAG: hypothetical protein ABIR35_03590 [Polaromonas sp.]
MNTFHAAVWADHERAPVLLFDRKRQHGARPLRGLSTSAGAAADAGSANRRIGSSLMGKR